MFARRFFTIEPYPPWTCERYPCPESITRHKAMALEHSISTWNTTGLSEGTKDGLHGVLLLFAADDKDRDGSIRQTTV